MFVCCFLSLSSILNAYVTGKGLHSFTYAIPAVYGHFYQATSAKSMAVTSSFIRLFLRNPCHSQVVFELTIVFYIYPKQQTYLCNLGYGQVDHDNHVCKIHYLHHNETVYTSLGKFLRILKCTWFDHNLDWEKTHKYNLIDNLLTLPKCDLMLIDFNKKTKQKQNTNYVIDDR